MKPFAYVRANTPTVAVKEATSERAQYLAGGTNLVDFMKLDVLSPSRVVDIGKLKLNQIEETSSGIRIGAMVTNSDLAYSNIIRARYPVLSQALLAGATPQIRNMATVGGNLLQRTRCTYFRDVVWACNKRDPGSGCSALEGCNRSHAVLGTSDKCIATHPSDMCVAMVALDAVIVVESSHGQRRINATEFFVPYGDDPAKENVLEHGELITHVELPNVPFLRRSHYYKVRDRASFEFALASAAVALDLGRGTIAAARVALGGVATKPWRATAAEKLLVGMNPDRKAFEAAAEVSLRDARAQKYNGFKIELAKRTIIRALETVAELS